VRSLSRSTLQARITAAASWSSISASSRCSSVAYSPGTTDIPGLEIAGTVVAVGNHVKRWKRGDRVCALVAGGGYAEYCTAPEGQCLPVPEGFSMIEAACIPETFFTVWTNVFQRGRLRQGETLLVHGGSSGIGTTAIQLAKAFGAKVFATAGSADKCKACQDLGADRAINYKTEDFVEVITKDTGGKGVDVVLDMVGGDYIPRSIKIMAVEGRHVSIAFLRGPKVELNVEPVMRKRLTSPARRCVPAPSSSRPRSRTSSARRSGRLILHEYSASGNCYKIRLTAALLGLPLERREYDIMKGETRTPEFLAEVNANGRIPVLQVGDRFIPGKQRRLLLSGRRLG
jgi:putative PIG3 family NAD(P)H quinone oxidoreductase